MILADTDILSAMAKVARVPLLFSLFQTTTLHMTPGVLRELEHSFNMGRQYAKDVFDLITAGRIRMTYLTPGEAAFRDTLPTSLSTGERDSIAVARERGGTVLSNESRVAHWCRQHKIPCLRLPDILRALWVEGVVPKQEVRDIMKDLQLKDRMQFKPSVIDAIVADS